MRIFNAVCFFGGVCFVWKGVSSFDQHILRIIGRHLFLSNFRASNFVADAHNKHALSNLITSILPYLILGRKLVSRAVARMVEIGCQEVALEAEVTNIGALHLYERQGFAREERLLKYYLNGVDAFRLKLWLKMEDDFIMPHDGRQSMHESGQCCGGKNDQHNEQRHPHGDKKAVLAHGIEANDSPTGPPNCSGGREEDIDGNIMVTRQNLTSLSLEGRHVHPQRSDAVESSRVQER